MICTQDEVRYGMVDLDLLEELSLPDDLGLLAQETRLWTPAVCGALLVKSDEIGFLDPQGGLEVARETVRMVDNIAGSYVRGAEKTLLKSRAFAVLGSRLRGTARLKESDLAYTLACGLSWGAPPLDVADLLRRRGLLRVNQRQFKKARMLENRALYICRREADEHLAGCVLLARGDTYFEDHRSREAIRDYAAAAHMIDPKRCFISHYGAVHNLSAALVRNAASAEEIAAAVEQIQQAKEIGFKEDTLPGLALVWLEGSLLEKIDHEDEAEAAYRTDGDGLVAIGAPYEVALVRLDLAALLCRQGRFEELVEVAAEMFPLFATFRANREVMTGLRLFHSAAVDRQVTLELISKVRAMIQRAARKVD